MQRFALVNQTARNAQRQPVRGRRQQQGVAMVIFSVGLVVIMAMAGLALDMGHAYVNKTRLQNAIDAAALSGASALYDQWNRYRLSETWIDKTSEEKITIAEEATSIALLRAQETFKLNFSDLDPTKFVFEFYTSLNHFDNFEDFKKNQLSSIINRMERDGIAPSDCNSNHLTPRQQSLCLGYLSMMRQYYPSATQYPTYLRITTGSNPLIKQNWLIQVLPGVGGTLAIGASALAGFESTEIIEFIAPDELERVFPIALCEPPNPGETYVLDLAHDTHLFLWLNHVNFNTTRAFAVDIHYTDHETRDDEVTIITSELTGQTLIDSRIGIDTRFGTFRSGSGTFTMQEGKYNLSYSADVHTSYLSEGQCTYNFTAAQYLCLNQLDLNQLDLKDTQLDLTQYPCLTDLNLTPYIDAGLKHCDGLSTLENNNLLLNDSKTRELKRRIAWLPLAECGSTPSLRPAEDDLCVYLQYFDFNHARIHAEFIDKEHCAVPNVMPLPKKVVLYSDRLSRSGI